MNCGRIKCTLQFNCNLAGKGLRSQLVARYALDRFVFGPVNQHVTNLTKISLIPPSFNLSIFNPSHTTNMYVILFYAMTTFPSALEYYEIKERNT